MKKTRVLSAAFVMLAAAPVLHVTQPAAQASALVRHLADDQLETRATGRAERRGSAEYASGPEDERVPQSETAPEYGPPQEDQQTPPGGEYLPAPQDEGAPGGEYVPVPDQEGSPGEQYLPAPQDEVPDQPGNPEGYQSDQGSGEQPIAIHELLPAPAEEGS